MSIETTAIARMKAVHIRAGYQECARCDQGWYEFGWRHNVHFPMEIWPYCYCVICHYCDADKTAYLRKWLMYARAFNRCVLCE